MLRLGLLGALVLAVSCGGKVSSGDAPAASEGAGPEAFEGPSPAIEPLLEPEDPGPVPVVDAGSDPASGDPGEPPGKGGPTPGGAPAGEDPEAAMLARCEELCAVPEVQCQPPFSEDLTLCLHACGRMEFFGDPISCPWLFIDLTYCLEEASMTADCNVDVILLIEDHCPDLFPEYLTTCAGAQLASPPDAGSVTCQTGAESSEPTACVSTRTDCSDGHAYEVRCASEADTVTCECVVDGVGTGLASGGGSLTLEELCTTPRGFEACGFLVAW